jgi:multicomponent Na+:H+ antiporter subunit E
VRGPLVAGVTRVALFALVWWAVAEDRPIAWGFAVAGVLAATVAATIAGGPERRWSPAGVARFVPFFVGQSIRGGVDVALRAVWPARDIHPGTMRYRTRLPVGPPRIFLAKVLSLLPGTLTCDLEGDTLTIHLLDTGSHAGRSPAIVERRVARVFGLGSGTDRGATDPPPNAGP